MNLRLIQLFRDALDFEGSERDAFLTQHCDATERAQVDALLKAASETKNVLPDLALNQFEQIQRLPVDRTGEIVGGFRLIKSLGSGGMGAVWLAERTEGFAQQVAIKWAHPVGLSSAMLARFAAERELLAKLDHPGIARIIDGGAEQGALWFAMEYVDGMALDRYVEVNKLDLASRVQLVSKLCEAVQYAHQNLIVHRDLKPSNVIVQAGGDPKLLDFGIAKRLGGADDFTRSQAPMSIAYAAPEQIRGEAITTATDVYALGVILYELLTGQRPHKSINGDSGVGGLSLLQAITDTDATAPSRVLRGQKSPSGFIAKQLQGDLDTIVLKALSRDPSRRYASAQNLGEDLQRFLNNRPVSARVDSISYLAGRWIRRNRALTVLGACALLSLSILAWSLVQQRAEALAQARAAREAERRSVLALEAQQLVHSHFIGVLREAIASTEAIEPEKLLDLSMARDSVTPQTGPDALRALLLSQASLHSFRKDEAALSKLLKDIAPLMADASAEEKEQYALAQQVLASWQRKSQPMTSILGVSGASALVIQAQLAAKRGDGVSAIALVSAAADSANADPNHDDAFKGLIYGNQARIALDFGDWALTERAAERSLTLLAKAGIKGEPAPTVAISMVVAVLAQGDLDGAAQRYQTATKRFPNLTALQRGSYANVQARLDFWRGAQLRAENAEARAGALFATAKAASSAAVADLCKNTLHKTSACSIARTAEVEFAVGAGEIKRAKNALDALVADFPDVDVSIWRALLSETDAAVADAAASSILLERNTRSGLSLALYFQQRLIVLEHCKRNRLSGCAKAAKDAALAMAKALDLPKDSAYRRWLE